MAMWSNNLKLILNEHKANLPCSEVFLKTLKCINYNKTDENKLSQKIFKSGII